MSQYPAKDQQVFAFQPLKAKAAHIFLVIFVAIVALAASIVFPSVRASAGPVGASASIASPACGSDARFTLFNNSKRRVRFDIWQKGVSEPVASIHLAKGSTTTISKKLTTTEQRFVVRIKSFALVDTVVTRTEICNDGTAPLPDVTDGVSATIVEPECGAFALATFNNGTSTQKRFDIVHGSAATPEIKVSVPGNAVISATSKAVLPVDLLQVRSPATTAIASVTVAATDKQPCPQPDAANTTNALQPFGEWGLPVRFDDFTGNSLKTGDGGWLVYDSPNGKTRRTKEAVKVGESESGTGEAKMIGFYDKSKGTHIGGGMADRFNQHYGRWEVRARTDKGAGFAPVILLWPQSGKWPDDGEIDLLEAPRGDRTKAIAVLHNGPRNTFRTKALDGDQSEWHIYAVEWLPNRVTFYLDGIEQWTVQNSGLVPTAGPMHLVVQNDAGCGWIQCPNGETKPETVMHVDWIKAYRAP